MTEKIKLEKLQRMTSIKDTNFFEAYKKLATSDQQNLTENEKFLLLKLAVIFINEGEKELEKFGYSIILNYSNNYGDYKPLYDIAMAKSYIPIAKKIEQEKFNPESLEKNFHKLFMHSYKENFLHIRNEKPIYFSEGQKRIYNFSKNDEDYIIVAPTSYGKSEIIIHKIEDNLEKNVCVIVPTKSLLAQTRRNLIENPKIRESQNRIITHPDMLGDISEKIIAVLTQERLLRLLQKHTELKFDIILVDEAHNLIENDNREILTIQDLKILKKRNANAKFHYFTPFLIDPRKIKIFSKEDKPLIDKIEEFIKIEKYYYCDLKSIDKKLILYDQFLNKSFDAQQFHRSNNDFDFVKQHAANKNIIYLNRPKNIELLANSISDRIEVGEKIKKVQKALKGFLHQDYNLVKTLENGIVYHHGSMPENVRLYVENAFSKIKEIKYIITSSTLLQGVNIPAEKIFLLDTRKGRGYLNASQFKNLTGRVCRFSDIFDKNSGDLQMLEPKIYLVKGQFNNRANLEKFLAARVKDDKIILDDIENPLIKQNLIELNEDEKKKVKEAEEYQENIESGSSNLRDIRTVESEIAKMCFKNNVQDFDIFENEMQLNENYENSKDMKPVSHPDNLIFLIAKIFLWKIALNQTGTDNFKRLENDKAKKFYAMLLGWRASGKSYNEMINSFMNYWENKKQDPYVYVGTKWGEITSPYKEGSRELYIDLSEKTNSQKINIAIIRIKEEQDFVDYRLMPYVEILNDLKLIEENFYNQIKYGTDDQKMIKMLKEGFSIELAKAIKNNYLRYLNFSDNNIEIKENIVGKMKEMNENEILIFEIKYYINQ